LKSRSLLYVPVTFALFFSMYLFISLALSKTSAFYEGSILFELDTPRVIGDMTTFNFNHYRTKVHPLYVLIMNPIGILVNKLVGSNVTTAVVINCFIGSAGVTLSFIYFWIYTNTIVDTVLLTLLFGISSSQLILSIIPDTSSLAICSLIVTYLLFSLSIKRGGSPLLLWILAGVFSLGVTTTNFVQTVICFGISHLISTKHNSLRDLVILVFKYLFGVLSVTILLSIIQKIIYPSSTLFFLPEAYIEDMSYASLLFFQEPFIVIAQLLKHFLWVNFIAPYPTIFMMSGKNLPAITFSNSLDFSIFGIVSSILWFTLLGTYVFKYLWQQNKNKTKPDYYPLLLGYSFCLLFNFVFHSFYGIGERGKIEYFLYTGNFTFLTLSILAIHFRLLNKRTLRMLLLATIVLIGINNYLVVKEIINIYALL